MSIWFVSSHRTESIEQVLDLDQETFENTLRRSDFLFFLKDTDDQNLAKYSNDIIIDLKNMIKKTEVSKTSNLVRLFKFSQAGVHTLSFKKDDLELQNFNSLSESDSEDVLYLLTPYHLKNGEALLRKQVLDILNLKTSIFDMTTIMIVFALCLSIYFLIYGI